MTRPPYPLAFRACVWAVLIAASLSGWVALAVLVEGLV